MSPGQYHRNFEPESVKYTPPNGYSTLSSIPYMVGAALVEGRATLAEVSDEKVKDPRILKIARKVTRVVDPSFEDYRSASVTIRMKDGRMYQHDQKVALGSPEMPATREMIEDKFLANVDGMLSKKRAQAVIDTVANLEQLHRVAELMRLLWKE